MQILNAVSKWHAPPRAGFFVASLLWGTTQQQRPLEWGIRSEFISGIVKQINEIMDMNQKEAVYRLLASMEGDEETQEDAKNRGNWYEYLLAHINLENGRE